MLRTIRPLSAEHMVLGQFRGYRAEPGVDPESQVPTYTALRLHVDSWRWQGVPFYLRAGKSMATTCTEVMIEFHNPPQVVFKEAAPPLGNYLRLRREHQRMEAYERLLGDAMAGDATLFVRQDVVEAAWAIVDPVIHGPSELHEYEPGTWGPADADALTWDVGGWNTPW